MIHAFSLKLELPEDGPDLETVKRLARAMSLTPDEFISRCVIAHTQELLEQFQDPDAQAWMALERDPSLPPQQLQPLE